MKAKATNSLRITSTTHRRLVEIARWAGGLSLANAAHLAISDYWTRKDAERKAEKAGR